MKLVCRMKGTEQSGTVATDLPTDRFTSYRLYLPTYNTVLAGAIGIPTGSVVRMDPRPGFATPAVVWYGTSILQGSIESSIFGRCALMSPSCTLPNLQIKEHSHIVHVVKIS